MGYQRHLAVPLPERPGINSGVWREFEVDAIASPPSLPLAIALPGAGQQAIKFKRVDKG